MSHIEYSTNRRGWLFAIISGLAGILSAAIGAPAAIYLFTPPKRARRSGWVDAGSFNELPLKTPQRVELQRVHFDAWKIRSESDAAWLVRTDAQSVTAFSPRCTHLGCAYHWEPRAEAFECPCHGSRFSITGKVLTGPAPRPLDQYPVRIEGDRLWLGDTDSTNSDTRNS
jgi:menaquinol-cytochrome c reductase iron-sulfur subunit